ncbi:calpain-A-like [Hetaerina americana]|uniref:calpain-A-like n=1 Tax=Hetaerina americana TaxID=62018 RepID=UPI003A7F5120
MPTDDSKSYVYKLGERGSGTKIKGDIQDYEKLRKECLSQAKLFEDPEFPPNSISLGQEGVDPWKRPGEICNNPHFILNGVSRFDLLQGELGDCWLISAIASITLNENVVSNIISNDQSYKEGEYAGIFHFRFWQLGKWVDVVVDDFLPIKYNMPRFLHSSDSNEFWGSLLEKAYAKLYGSYRALSSGTPSEALEDFTGGLTENIKVSDYTAIELFKLMKKAFARSSLMGCAIETHKKSSKLYEITTYIVIYIFLTWSSEWKTIVKSERERIGLAFDKDGEFWMSVKDFKQNFSCLDITHLGPEALRTAEDDGRRKWEVNEFHGKWVRGVSAGGSDNSNPAYGQNPQYFITIEDPDPDDDDDETKSTVIVSLMQRSKRSSEQKSANLFIGFSIYHVENPERQSKPLEHKFFLYNRAERNQNTYVNRRAVTYRFLLPPGTYCIVPSTYDANEEGEYLLRVFSEKYNDMREHDEEFGEEETEGNVRADKGKQQEQLDGNLEKKLNAAFSQAKGNELDWKQMNQLLDSLFEKETKGKGISKDNCRSMVALMDGDKSGKLGQKECKTLLLNVKKWALTFAKYDADKSGNLDIVELKDALTSAGFRLSKRVLYMLVHRFADNTGKMNFDDFLMCAEMEVGTFVMVAQGKNTSVGLTKPNAMQDGGKDLERIRDYHDVGWVNGFECGHTSTNYEHHSQHPVEVTSSEMINKIHYMVLNDPQIKIVQTTGISQGDCWLISAIANITLNQNVIDNVISKDQTYKDDEYAGIFHFRFWQLGKWVDIVVDDRLPIKYNRPMFLHSKDNNEFWGSLLEKAYAKLNGSYQALVAGFTYEALEDFTGGLTEVIKLPEYNSSNLFRIMKKAYDRSSLMGCSIEQSGGIMEGRTSLGLITTHAYSVTNVREVTLTNGQKIQLVRLRNPWGNEAEWKGAWSDGSREWNSISQEDRNKIGLTFDNDGEFWMTVQDFKQNFSSLDMTHLGPEAFRTTEGDGRRRWEVQEFHGQWVTGVSAGGCNVCTNIYHQNPQYLITVEDPDPEDGDYLTKNTVIISLMQRSRRAMGQGATNLCIGFSIYRVENPERQSKPLNGQYFMTNPAVNKPAYAYQRAVTSRLLLTPGTYCIVPTTYQYCVDGEYLLRVFSEKYNEIKEHDEEIGEEESEENEEEEEAVDEKIKAAFTEACGDDQEIDWKELKQLLDPVFEEGYLFAIWKDPKMRTPDIWTRG